MRAVVVLPTPRTPVRIQACGMRPVSNALEMVRTIASWPIRSLKFDGRYLRASTRYDMDGAPPGPPRSRPASTALSFLVASFMPKFGQLSQRHGGRALPAIHLTPWQAGTPHECAGHPRWRRSHAPDKLAVNWVGG